MAENQPNLKLEERITDIELLLRRVRSELTGHSHSATLIEGAPPATPTDHGSLGGLSDDDHIQYLDSGRHATMALHPLGVVVPHDDHGLISGLGDDDHPHYFRADGTRNMSGNLKADATSTRDIGTPTVLWRKAYIAEIDALVLAEQTISMVGGWLIVGKDQGTLPADLASGATTCNFGKSMTNGDVVRMKNATQEEYLRVGALVSGTTYNVTRNLDGSGANDWIAGTAFHVLGQAGNGWLELNAYDTPRMSVFTQNSTTYSDKTERVRIGDLKDWDGNSASRYGLAVGDYAGGNYFRYYPYNAGDANSGLTLKSGSGGVNIDNSGFSLIMDENYAGNREVRFVRNSDPTKMMFAISGKDSSFSDSSYLTIGNLYGADQRQDTTINLYAVGKSVGTLQLAATNMLSYWKSSIITLGVSGPISFAQLNSDQIQLNGDVQRVNFSSETEPSAPGTNKSIIWNKSGVPLSKSPLGYKYPLPNLNYLKEIENYPGATIAWTGIGHHGTGAFYDQSGAGYTLSGISMAGQKYMLDGIGVNRRWGDLNGTSSYLDYATIANVLLSGVWWSFAGWFYLDAAGRAHGIYTAGATTVANDCYITATNYVVSRYYRADGALRTHQSSNQVATGWNYIGVRFWWSNDTPGSGYFWSIFLNGTWTHHTAGGIGQTGRAAAGAFRVGVANAAYLDGGVGPGCYGVGVDPDAIETLYEATKFGVAGW